MSFLLLLMGSLFFHLLQRRRLITHANAKSKSEKFPPPHQDGTLGYPLGSSHHIDADFDPPETSLSTVFPYQKGGVTAWSGPLIDPAAVSHPKQKKQGGSARMSSHIKQLVGAHATKESQKDKNGNRVR